MRKYIVKQKAISALITEADTHSNPVKKAYTRAVAIIEQIAADDVQPVNQWINVKDRLPEIGKSVLVAVSINAKLNLPFRTDFTPEIRIGWLDDNGEWGLQFDSADKDEILYWQPLPESPKEE